MLNVRTIAMSDPRAPRIAGPPSLASALPGCEFGKHHRRRAGRRPCEVGTRSLPGKWLLASSVGLLMADKQSGRLGSIPPAETPASVAGWSSAKDGRAVDLWSFLPEPAPLRARNEPVDRPAGFHSFRQPVW